MALVGSAVRSPYVAVSKMARRIRAHRRTNVETMRRVEQQIFEGLPWPERGRPWDVGAFVREVARRRGREIVCVQADLGGGPVCGLAGVGTDVDLVVVSSYGPAPVGFFYFFHELFHVVTTGVRRDGGDAACITTIPPAAPRQGATAELDTAPARVDRVERLADQFASDAIGRALRAQRAYARSAADVTPRSAAARAGEGEVLAGKERATLCAAL